MTEHPGISSGRSRTAGPWWVTTSRYIGLPEKNHRCPATLHGSSKPSNSDHESSPTRPIAKCPGLHEATVRESPTVHFEMPPFRLEPVLSPSLLVSTALPLGARKRCLDHWGSRRPVSKKLAHARILFTVPGAVVDEHVGWRPSLLGWRPSLLDSFKVFCLKFGNSIWRAPVVPSEVRWVPGGSSHTF